MFQLMYILVVEVSNQFVDRLHATTEYIAHLQNHGHLRRMYTSLAQLVIQVAKTDDMITIFCSYTTCISCTDAPPSLPDSMSDREE